MIPGDLDLHLIVVGERLTQRSEEHTSELQSRFDLVCRLLLEKKNKIKRTSVCADHGENVRTHSPSRLSDIMSPKLSGAVGRLMSRDLTHILRVRDCHAVAVHS